MGKAVGILIVLTALLGGAVLYYLQVYAFYTQLPPGAVADLRVTLADGSEAPVTVRSRLPTASAPRALAISRIECAIGFL